MLESTFTQWLQKHFGNGLRMNESMAAHTSFRVGGPAEAYVAVDSEEQLRELVQGCVKAGVTYFVLAGGTNLLVKDNGIQGVVIDIKKGLKGIVRHPSEGGRVKISVGAGVRLRALCRFAMENGLAGMNFALGIPGTVGGAVVMNAGTAGGVMADVVSSLRVLTPAGRFVTKEKNEMAFEYRKMALSAAVGNPGARPVIVSVDLVLREDDPQRVRDEADTILNKRTREQPVNAWSAGCFFKNPSSGESAGRLIDLAGLKGLRVGDAVVSEQHANFIVNAGQARAADILVLMERVRTQVAEIFGIRLEPEVEIVGD